MKLRIKSRRPAREAALAGLYLVEMSRARADTAIQQLESYQGLADDLREFADLLFSGVLENRAEIDRLIGSKLKQYDLSRIAVVDKSILRIACFELYHVGDVPPKVSIDEAIELAKKYSTAESGRFVNGVLGAVLSISPKADWTPPAVEELEEPASKEPEVEPVVISEDAPEVQELAKVGKWKLRTEEPED